jgi:hypothetical protein
VRQLAARGRPDELNAQIRATRASGATGDIHFSMRTLMPLVGVRRDSVLVGVATQPPRQVAAAALTDKLRDELYASPSLIPASPWLGKRAPRYRPRCWRSMRRRAIRWFV